VMGGRSFKKRSSSELISQQIGDEITWGAVILSFFFFLFLVSGWVYTRFGVSKKAPGLGLVKFPSAWTAG